MGARMPKGRAGAQATHILVVDDDPEVREVIEEYLSEEGFRVSLAPDGPAMWAVLAEDSVDLVILDVKLPGEDGLSLAAELRRRGDSAIIMLSRKDDLVDRVAGLEVGADDYVAKPFHLRELLARVRSVLRRRDASPGQSAPAAKESARASLRFAGWVLDPHARRLTGPDDRPVELSSAEFDLLLAFLEHPGRALSRDRLLDLARGREAAAFDRSIDVQVGRLRRKIEPDPKRPALIKTVRGAGYMFAAAVERH